MSQYLSKEAKQIKWQHIGWRNKSVCVQSLTKAKYFSVVDEGSAVFLAFLCFLCDSHESCVHVYILVNQKLDTLPARQWPIPGVFISVWCWTSNVLKHMSLIIVPPSSPGSTSTTLGFGEKTQKVSFRAFALLHREKSLLAHRNLEKRKDFRSWSWIWFSGVWYLHTSPFSLFFSTPGQNVWFSGFCLLLTWGRVYFVLPLCLV